MTISLRRFNRNTLDFDKVELLKGLDVNTRYKIKKCLVMHHYNKGDVIFRKGSTGQSLFFVKDGIMDVVVGNDDADPNDPSSYVVDQIMPGSVFGEMALLLSMPRTATICAKTEATVAELQRSDFEAAAERSWVLNERLEAIKEERFLRFRQDLEHACLNPNEIDTKQRAHLIEVFKQIDTDGSGAIDKDELAVMLTRLAGRFFSDGQVTFMMQMLDEDGNGTIEAQEFIGGLPLLAKWLVTSQLGSDDPAAELDLEKVELLKGIDAKTRAKIVMALKKRQFNQGDIVFKKGTTGQSLYFLQQGVMDVVVGDGDADPRNPNSKCLIVDRIHIGSVFGEMALLLSMPRTATIRTASANAVAFELERADFESAASSSSILRTRLDSVKEERFARFRHDLETAVLRPEEMDDKQRAYLLEVFKQIDTDGSGAIDQEELSAMLHRLAGRHFCGEEVAAMMDRLDKSGNMTIEADEFFVGLPLLAKWLTSETSSEPAAESADPKPKQEHKPEVEVETESESEPEKESESERHPQSEWGCTIERHAQDDKEEKLDNETRSLDALCAENAHLIAELRNARFQLKQQENKLSVTAEQAQSLRGEIDSLREAKLLTEVEKETVAIEALYTVEKLKSKQQIIAGMTDNLQTVYAERDKLLAELGSPRTRAADECNSFVAKAQEERKSLHAEIQQLRQAKVDVVRETERLKRKHAAEVSQLVTKEQSLQAELDRLKEQLINQREDVFNNTETGEHMLQERSELEPDTEREPGTQSKSEIKPKPQPEPRPPPRQELYQYFLEAKCEYVESFMFREL